MASSKPLSDADEERIKLIGRHFTTLAPLLIEQIRDTDDEEEEKESRPRRNERYEP